METLCNIARYLAKSRPTLHCLALASSGCRVAAQMQLFQSISYQVTADRGWIEQFTTFMSGHPVSHYVKGIALAGMRCHPHPVVCKSDILKILLALPTLRRLELHFLRWGPNHAPDEQSLPDNEPFTLNTLRECHLENIYLVIPTVSPIQILSFSKSWKKVELESIYHESADAVDFGFDVPIEDLHIRQSVWRQPSYTLPLGKSISKSVTRLSIAFANHIRPQIVKTILEACQSSLECFRIVIHPYDSCTYDFIYQTKAYSLTTIQTDS